MGKYLERYRAERPHWGTSMSDQAAQRRNKAALARAEAAAEYLADIAMDGTDVSDS